MNTSEQVKWNINDCLVILSYTFLNYERRCTFSLVPPICDEISLHTNVLLSLLYHLRRNQNNTILCSRYLTSKNIRSTYLYSNSSIAILVQNWKDHSHHANQLPLQLHDLLFCSSLCIPTNPYQDFLVP